MIAFPGRIDGRQALFTFLQQFDDQFDSKGLENAERFEPIINKLVVLRSELIKNLDMIMYYPVLYFGVCLLYTSRCV